MDEQALFLPDDRDIQTVVADPPWDCERGGGGRGAQNHYPLMGRRKIVRVIQQQCEPWQRLDDSAHLYLWTTNAALARGDAHFVCRSLGFEPKTLITWSKKDDGDPQIGMGFYFRHCTEQIMFCTRGETIETRSNTLTTLIEAPKTEHSAKPDSSYELIEEASPGAYLELFARQDRPGWICWGNEL